MALNFKRKASCSHSDSDYNHVDHDNPLPSDCQKTANSVKALFPYTPSPMTTKASARDPPASHRVRRHKLIFSVLLQSEVTYIEP